MIIVARHGQTEWNKAKKVQGWLNSPLTELGKEQAQSVGNQIAKRIDTDNYNLVTSPLGRAQQTAQIISQNLPRKVDPILEPRLKEYCYGNWQGRTLEQIRKDQPEQWSNRQADKWNYQVPGGESYAVLAKRVSQWLQTLNPLKTTIAVTHQMTSRVIRGIYLGYDEQATMKLGHDNNEFFILCNSQVQRVSAQVIEPELN